MCVAACHADHGHHWAGARAVGTSIGGGSTMFGPSDCTYAARPEVATFARDDQGRPFMAELTGPGIITETCGSTVNTYDVLVPTALRIDGPAVVERGAGIAADFGVTLLAGERTLLGLSSGGVRPTWSLGPDCSGVARFDDPLGSQDTGGPAITRIVLPEAPGNCTVRASVLGLATSRVIRVR